MTTIQNVPVSSKPDKPKMSKKKKWAIGIVSLFAATYVGNDVSSYFVERNRETAFIEASEQAAGFTFDDLTKKDMLDFRKKVCKTYVAAQDNEHPTYNALYRLISNNTDSSVAGNHEFVKVTAYGISESGCQR